MAASEVERNKGHARTLVGLGALVVVQAANRAVVGRELDAAIPA